MHTFFINTSKKAFKDYDVLLDIYYENKALVSQDCRLPDWYDAGKGYLHCVQQMSEMIDSCAELNNAYNLILYLDLSENETYSSIPTDEFHTREREACLYAMIMLFTHIIKTTIVAELTKSGRKPQNTLIMFGEDKPLVRSRENLNVPSEAKMGEMLLSLIGLPEWDAIYKLTNSLNDGSGLNQVEEFQQKVKSFYRTELIGGVRDSYEEALKLWFDEILYEASPEHAHQALFRRMNQINQIDMDRHGIEIVLCPYDGYASTVNKCALALSQLNILIYLSKCVNANSIYEEVTPGASEKRQVMEFHIYTAEELAPFFAGKKFQFSQKATEIESLSQSYSELKLAPQLMAFDHDKFGLDEYGDEAADYIVTDQTGEETENEKASDAGEHPIQHQKKKLVMVKRQEHSLFTKDEYPAFDYRYDSDGDQMLKKDTTPEQYIEQAKKTRKHHLNYLKKLKIHISTILSNYAGKSKENKNSLLQMGGYRYARSGETEKKVLEAVEGISDKAYESALNRYIEFCANRSVAITDIEEQCDWFVSKIEQIKESLKKIKLVAIGLLIALIVLYLPFFILQFGAITENVVTITVALGSFAIPVALLYAVFTVVALVQRKKYLKAWKEFKEKSNQALEQNAIVAEKYDQLLSMVVPSLRWVYEYKLDVQFCVECCKVADAKLEHHKKKLAGRISAIRNILGDLEYQSTDQDVSSPTSRSMEEIDYDLPFCSGKKNIEFYTILNHRFWNWEKEHKGV